MIEQLISPGVGLASSALAIAVCSGAMIIGERRAGTLAARCMAGAALVMVCLALTLVVARFAVVAA